MAKKVQDFPGQLRREIHLARAAAIEAYSLLEHQLCLQFADLMNTTPQKAELVFYRVTNAFSRNRILESLLEQEYGKTYSKFWGSLIKLIRQLDQERNKIVHWHLVGQEPIEDTDEVEEDEYLLVPHGDSEEYALTAKDLRAFVEKSEWVRTQAMMFYLFHLSRPSPEARRADKTYEAFQQRCLYPPSKDNPGFHFGPISQTPPQASEE